MKKMKGIIPLIVTGLVFSLGACNNNKDEGSSKKPNASSVSSLPKINVKDANNKTNASVVIGNTIQLTADQTDVTWSSLDTNVATVDANGLVTAVSVGETSIKVKKDGFKDGSFGIVVTRPKETALISFDDADHYSADGWWENNGRGPGAQPIYDKSSANGGKCVAYFGEGDKETLTFTSSAAVKAELVITMGHNDSHESLSEIMDAEFNGKAIDLSKTAFTTDDSSGNYSFLPVSFGEVDIKNNADNVLVLTMKGNAPYLDDLYIYAKSDATIAVKKPAEKQTIVIKNDENSLSVVEGSTLQLTSDTTGLKFKSESTNVATVDENTGLVTGVSKGSAKISVTKAGMISTRVTVTVTERVVTGEFKVEAETGTHNGQPLTKESEGINSRDASTGETTTNAWTTGEVLVIDFQAETAGTYTMYLNGRHSSYSGGTNINLGTDMEFKLNNNVISGITAEISGYTFTNYLLGDVTLNKGANKLEVKLIGETRPQIDYFKFTPKA